MWASTYSTRHRVCICSSCSLGLLISLWPWAIVDARLGQYRYARTVNLIRAYFADMDKDIMPYLYMPTTSDDSIFRQARIRGSQANIVAAVGALYAGLRYALGIRAEDPLCPLTQAAFLRLPSPLSTWLRISCTEPGVLWRWSENVSPSDPSTRFATVIPKRRVLLVEPARSKRYHTAYPPLGLLKLGQVSPEPGRTRSN